MSGQQLPSIFDWTAGMGQQNQGQQPLGSFPSENYGSEAVAQPQGIMPTAPKPNAVGQLGQQGLGAANAYQLGNSMWGGAPAASAPAAEAGAYQLPTQLGIGGPTQAPAASSFGVALPAAAAVAGTYLGREAANRSGPTAQGAWGVANAMNPINAAMEAPGAIQNVASGERLGFGTQAALAIPTMGASFAYNPLFGRGGVFGSSKGKDQVARDQVRSAAVSNKWFDKDYQVDLGNGLVLDMGKDGGYKYTNPDGSERSFNNTDPNDQNAPQGIGWLHPLAAIMAEGDQKLTSSFVAQFYNELTKDGNAKEQGTVRSRVIDLYKKFGLKPSNVLASLEELKKRGQMPDNVYQAMVAGINNLRPGQKPQLEPGQQPGESPKNVPAVMAPKPVPTKKPDGKPVKPLGSGGD